MSLPRDLFLFYRECIILELVYKFSILLGMKCILGCLVCCVLAYPVFDSLLTNLKNSSEMLSWVLVIRFSVCIFGRDATEVMLHPLHLSQVPTVPFVPLSVTVHFDHLTKVVPTSLQRNLLSSSFLSLCNQ